MTVFLWAFGIGLILLLIFNKKLRARILNLVRRNNPVQGSKAVLEMPPVIQQSEDVEEVPESFWWRGREIQKSRFNEWPQYFSYRNRLDYLDMMIEIHSDKEFWGLMREQSQMDRSERFYVMRWITFRKAQDEK